MKITVVRRLNVSAMQTNFVERARTCEDHMVDALHTRMGATPLEQRVAHFSGVTLVDGTLTTRLSDSKAAACLPEQAFSRLGPEPTENCGRRRGSSEHEVEAEDHFASGGVDETWLVNHIDPQCLS